MNEPINQEFEFELYSSEAGEQMLWVCAYGNASGAECSYETFEDIGKAISDYLKDYYEVKTNENAKNSGC